MQSNTYECDGKLTSVWKQKKRTVLTMMIKEKGRPRYVSLISKKELPEDLLVEGTMLKVTGRVVAFRIMEDKQYKKRVQYFEVETIEKSDEDSKYALTGHLDGVLVGMKNLNGYSNMFVKTNEPRSSYVKISALDKDVAGIAVGDVVSFDYVTSVSVGHNQDGKKIYYEDFYLSK